MLLASAHLNICCDTVPERLTNFLIFVRFQIILYMYKYPLLFTFCTTSPPKCQLHCICIRLWTENIRSHKRQWARVFGSELGEAPGLGRHHFPTMVRSTIIARASDALPLAASSDDEEVNNSMLLNPKSSSQKEK